MNTDSGTQERGTGSLERMVRHENEMRRAILNGIKPPISEDAKTMIMEWVASENKETIVQVQNTELDSQRLKQAPTPPFQAGLESSRLDRGLPPSLHDLQLTLAGFCIRISYCGVPVLSNDTRSATANKPTKEQ